MVPPTDSLSPDLRRIARATLLAWAKVYPVRCTRCGRVLHSDKAILRGTGWRCHQHEQVSHR